MTKKLGLQVKIKGDKKWYDVLELENGSHVSAYQGDDVIMFYEWDDVSCFRSTNPKLFSDEKK